MFQTARCAVDVDTGAVGNALVSNTWFDAAGNVIKQQSAGSQAFTKTVFDWLGRAEKQYLGHDPDETLVVSSAFSASAGSGLLEPFPSPGTCARNRRRDDQGAVDRVSRCPQLPPPGFRGPWAKSILGVSGFVDIRHKLFT